MRPLTTIRFPVSVLCAALVHGVVFGAAAVVLSREPTERPVPPAPLDVEVVQVAPPRAGPMADTLVQAKLVGPRPVSRHPRVTAPLQAVALTDKVVDLADSAVAHAPAPSPPAPSAPPALGPAPAASLAPPVAAPSADAAIVGRPRYRIEPRPLYPLPSLRRREEGLVLVEVVVQPNGVPAAVALHKSCGHPLLDRAALDAVRRSMLEPGPARTVVVPIRFSLSDGPGR